jgi:hypothetical protein
MHCLPAVREFGELKKETRRDLTAGFEDVEGALLFFHFHSARVCVVHDL